MEWRRLMANLLKRISLLVDSCLRGQPDKKNNLVNGVQLACWLA